MKLIGAEVPACTGFPTVFWNVFGELGHPVRATITDPGPSLLSRILNLNETQEGALMLVFKVADKLMNAPALYSTLLLWLLSE